MIVRVEEWVVCVSILVSTINRFCVHYVRMNLSEAHLMVTSRVIDFKGFRMLSSCSFSLIRRQNCDFNVRWFLFGVSPSMFAMATNLKLRILLVDIATQSLLCPTGKY